MMKSKPAIGIIGAGVNGLSCAVYLQNLGYKVKIFTEYSINKYTFTPWFSSLFPAASIIPHSVYSDETKPLFVRSQQYFKTLYKNNFPGLEQHVHYELFGFSQPPPAYLELMREAKLFEQFRHDFHPNHPKIPIKTGWKFFCFFADWPVYFPALHQKFLEQGGDIEHVRLKAGDVGCLPFDVIINCAGYGATALVGDQNRCIERGHLLHIPQTAILKNPLGQTVSYNFSPGTEYYASAKGSSQDIYCYPRHDGWIWGGSRLRGTFTEKGIWKGDKVKPPQLTIGEEPVPEAVYKLNADIIAHTFGADIPPARLAKLQEGFRYIRKVKNGLRLEAEETKYVLLIHNYGHGGAGVTLSWGCAAKVADLIQQHF